MLQKEIKDLTFEVFNPSTDFFKKLFPIKDHKFIMPIWRGGGEVLKFVKCLQILLLLKQQIYCSFLGMWWCVRVGDAGLWSL